MSPLVSFRVSLWVVPRSSRRTEGPGWSVTPFRVQTGALLIATETSHWKQAEAGAVTLTSSRSCTITRAWAGRGEERREEGMRQRDGEVV